MKGQEEKEEVFKFKQFEVSHSSSSMKIGVDGVLLGAWGDIKGDMGLDIGCGCGVIGLMAAQRNRHCRINMIDIHQSSIEEAIYNIRQSPWNKRISAFLAEANDFASNETNQGKYDFILSNPPFFSAGIKTPITPREKARHEASLSPSILIEIAKTLLKPGGTLSFITTHEILSNPLLNLNSYISRICKVANRPDKVFKRVMVTIENRGLKTNPFPKEEILYIRDGMGQYSSDYRALTKDFYLNF